MKTMTTHGKNFGKNFPRLRLEELEQRIVLSTMGATSLEWVETHDGPLHGSDAGQAVAVDANEDVYVVGTEIVFGSDSDIWLRKYDGDGNTLWTDTYDSPAHRDDQGFGVAVDGSGDVYVVGSEDRTDLGQGADIWLRKYDSDGNVLWTRTYDSPAHRDDQGYDVAVDNDGGVYVVGTEYRHDLGERDNIWLGKYDTDGNVLWTQTHDGAASRSDIGYGVAVDDSSNVFVIGSETVGGQNADIWIAKYDSGGNQQWSRTYDGGSPHADGGRDIAVGEDGNIYAAGVVYTSDGHDDVWIGKLDTNGNFLWTDIYDGPSHKTDYGADVAAGAGGVYVVGVTDQHGQHSSGWIRRYDYDGNVQWTETFDGGEDRTDSALGVAVDEADNLYVAGVFNDDIALLKYSQPYLCPTVSGFRAEWDLAADPDEINLVTTVAPEGEGYITRVEFYCDTNDNRALDVDTDELLGTGTDMGNDEWQWSGTVPDFDLGENVLFVRAQDDGGEWSDAEGVTILKMNRRSGLFTFTDADGDATTIDYTGTGEALVQFHGNTADDSDIESVVVTGARRSASFIVESSGETPVGDVQISGRRFNKLEIDGNLDSLAVVGGKTVNRILVNGTLGDVDASDVGRITLLQADDITGVITAQHIKQLVANGDLDGASVTATGRRGKIDKLHVDGNVVDSDFSAEKGIKEVFIGGDVLNGSFDAYGSKADFGEFTVNGSFSGSLSAGRDLKLLDCGGTLDADIEVGRNLKSLMAGELDAGRVSAGGEITSAVFQGAVYGTMDAYNIEEVRTSDYFRDPHDFQQNSYTEHLFSENSLDLAKIWDADGNMNGR